MSTNPDKGSMTSLKVKPFYNFRCALQIVSRGQASSGTPHGGGIANRGIPVAVGGIIIGQNGPALETVGFMSITIKTDFILTEEVHPTCFKLGQNETVILSRSRPDVHFYEQ